VNVTAISNSTQATRQFTIFIGNPKEIANATITAYKKRIPNITTQINSYPVWASAKLQSLLGLSNLTTKLNNIELDYNNATTEEEYRDIMLRILAINVPISVRTSDEADNLPLSVGYESINPNYIEQITNQDLNNADLIDQITGWMTQYYNPVISYKQIEVLTDSGSENIGTIFTIQTNPADIVNSEVYLVIGQDVENSGFYNGNYNVQSITSGVDYITLTDQPQTIEFFIEGENNAENLGAYISPALDTFGDIEAPSAECNLNNICDSNEDASTCPEDCSKRWIKFTVILWVLLGLGGLVGYIILQEWYKRNYQKSLFPNSNDLFNLINFIYNARRSGLLDSEIKSKLREQKWSGERIRFAFRKIEGKRVGMLEIPIFTRKEHKEVIKQLAARQKNPIDARFIKRPTYS
jgi:hypothetical protein